MDFDDVKENIQPLAAGRNATILQASLQADSHQELQLRRNQFENAIKNYEGDDPLEPWYEYVLWIEQSFPSGGKESGLEEVLLKCLAAFEKDDRYYQDRRMIKLYIKYIDTHEDPQECYQKLYSQGIGTMVADLYICWAYYFDLVGNFRKADQVFRKGIECRAQPIEELQEAHQHFGFTMSQRILYNDDSSNKKYQTTMLEKRRALTSLNHNKKKIGSIRTGAAVKSSNPGQITQNNSSSTRQTDNRKVIVFEDENQTNAIPTSEPDSETSVVKAILDNARKQENVKEPGPWSKQQKVKGNLFSSGVSSEPSFQILEDDTSSFGSIKPFLYFDGFKANNEPQEEWNLPVTVENELMPNSYPSYDKCLLYPRPNSDLSIEELGCYYWCKKRNVENSFTKKYDPLWKNDIAFGIRMYPNFAKTNKQNTKEEPKPSNFNFNDCNVKGKSNLAFDPKLCYPSELEELQFEEIMANSWISGKRKLNGGNETIALAEEMEETTCLPSEGPRRKSFFPTRKSTAVLPHQMPTINRKEHKSSEGKEPDSSNFAKTDVFTPSPPVVKEVFTVYEDDQEDPSFSFKMPTASHKQTDESVFKVSIEKDANEFEANETCSTQAFNCFIKPQSVSTPKAINKEMKTIASENQPKNINFDGIENVSVSVNQNYISNNVATSPEYNDGGLTLQCKQLSTIMETSEQGTGGTVSTKSSISPPDMDGEYQMPKTPRINNVCNLETVKEAISPDLNNFENVSLLKSMRKHEHEHSSNTLRQQNDLSHLEQRENTIPRMPTLRTFEEHTQTIPKILFTKNQNSQLALRPAIDQRLDIDASSDKMEDFFCKSPNKNRQADTLPNKQPISTITRQQNDFSRLEQKEDTVPMMPSLRTFEERTETIPKILFTKNQISQLEDSNCFAKYGQHKKNNNALTDVDASTDKITDFFYKNANKSRHTDNNPPLTTAAAVANKSIFTASAFMNFEDSEVLKADRSYKTSLLDMKKDPKQSKDSSFLPNVSEKFKDNDPFIAKNNVRSSSVESNDKKSILLCEKPLLEDRSKILFSNSSILQRQHSKQNTSNENSKAASEQKSTEDFFLSGFPSVAIQSNAPNQDSYLLPNVDSLNFDLTLERGMNKKHSVNQKTDDLIMNMTKNSDESLFNRLYADANSLNLSSEAIAYLRRGRNISVGDSLKSVGQNDDTNKLINQSVSKKQNVELFQETKQHDFTKQSQEFKSMTQKNQESTGKDSIKNDISLCPNFSILEDIDFQKPKTNFKEKSFAKFPETPSKTLSSNLECPLKPETFYEDNIRSEAFSTNLSMIKNSTWLPNHKKSQAQSQKENVNEFNSSFSPPVSQSFFLATPSKEKARTSESMLPQKRSIATVNESRTRIQPPASLGECIEIPESDDESDCLGKSIYYTKTPKTPKIFHTWSPEPENEDGHVVDNNFVHTDVDLDQTHQTINDICIAADVNPFNRKLIEAFLAQIELISYIENLPHCQMVRKVMLLKKDVSVVIGGKVFSVSKPIGEGSFGTVYCAKELESGKMFALKQERPANFWEFYICLELQSRLHSTEMLPGFMKIEYALIGNNASILASNFSRYGSLIAVCNKIKKETLKNVDEYVVMHITSQLLLIIDHLHASNIIHADVKPDNFLLMDKLVLGKKNPTIQLIDFGNAIDMQLFPKGQKFTYSHEMDQFKCIEMREKRPWTFQLDLFGLAGVIHVLLFGKYMELVKKPTGWTHRTHIPRYFNKPLWEIIFQSLLNITDCMTMPNLQHLRALLEEEIAENDKSVCQKIIEFNRALDM